MSKDSDHVLGGNGVGGGYNRANLRPLRPDGNLLSDSAFQILGCHKGDFEQFNVYDPMPNHNYSWANDTPARRAKMRRRGSTPVQEGDREHRAYEAYTGIKAELQNGCLVNDGQVLMRTPIEKYREIEAEIQKQRELMFHGGSVESEFSAGGARANDTYGGDHRPLRFARADHSARVSEVTAGGEQDAGPFGTSGDIARQRD